MKTPKTKRDRLEAAVAAIVDHQVSREAVEELIYASAAALRQGNSVTTAEIEQILIKVPTILDLREEY